MEGFVCPICRADLLEGETTWRCSGCDHSYRALRGIPDLRTANDTFLPNQDDWDYALRLNEAYNRLDFRGLLEYYFDLSPEIPLDLRRRQIAHILTASGRVRQWRDALGETADGPILDLGCGSGSCLSALARNHESLWGIDIALRWLIVARKRLDEEGVRHVRLVCGCAERLPIRDGVLSGIMAGDVIEHVADQAATMAEAHRTLRPGGRVVLASPNRFSLTPEPHVGVWGVGFLPRSWMAPYVRRTRGLDFRAIHTLGYADWTRLLRRSPFRGGRIEAPTLPEADLEHFRPFKRFLGRTYNCLVRTWLGQVIAKRVGPLFHIVCTREPTSDAEPLSSRAIRRHSTPSAATR